MSSTFIRAAALAAGAFFAFAGLAQAHVTLAQSEARPGTYLATLNVPHGCDGQPTLKVKVTIPPEFKSVKPMPKAGWTLDIVKSADRITEIVWTGSLEDAHFDQFAIRGQIVPEAAGQMVPLIVVQDCKDGRVAWDQVAAAGQDPHSLKSPAPVIKVAAAEVKDVKAGDLVIAAPWARATPAGAKVGGGYITIRNTGATPDRLVGGSLVKAGKFEIHDMSMKDGVMIMRPLPEGVTIAPGETVALAPGGKHLMFVDLKDGLKDGETVSGTLVFEKAGTVQVSFKVTGIGSREAPGAPAHEHKH